MWAEASPHFSHLRKRIVLLRVGGALPFFSYSRERIALAARGRIYSFTLYSAVLLSERGALDCLQKTASWEKRNASEKQAAGRNDNLKPLSELPIPLNRHFVCVRHSSSFCIMKKPPFCRGKKEVFDSLLNALHFTGLVADGFLCTKAIKGGNHQPFVIQLWEEAPLA